MFIDHSKECKDAVEFNVKEALDLLGEEIKSKAAQNTRVDTGKTRDAWEYRIEESEDEGPQLVVGNPLENAIWEEFGTGEYALDGNGRKTSWVYQDRKGKWHRTTGKTPSRALYKAYMSTQDKIQKVLEAALKELNEE